jgi:hypothetical protein
MRSTRLVRAAVAAVLLTAPARPATAGPPTADVALVSAVTARTTGLRPEVLREALDAAADAWRSGRATRTDRLTVIDYSLPSTEKRLWVLDLSAGTVLFHELVAHGKHSGDNVTTRFSNAMNSLQTSLGLFVTADAYVGQNGYSLRLDGLEPGLNDRARDRAIVVHGAAYVNEAITRTLGRLGRSWGCPAVPLGVARPLIDAIKGGTAVFAYHPQRAAVGLAAR